MSRVVLIGCGKSKQTEPAPAADLYTGNLFAARRAFAERSGARWFILSALYGLLDPARVVEPYDMTMASLPVPVRTEWALQTVAHLVREGARSVELHAGADYSARLVTILAAVGISSAWPVHGLGIGQQLAWYGAANTTRPAQEVRHV